MRKEWWKSLTETIDRLDAPAIIGLTATPPYDVAPWEWDRYMQVSGPVDAEIAAPELVKEGNLCPHQDYVYISLPEKDEGERISEFRAEVKVVLDEVIRNKEFVRALSTHPWVQHPDDYAEEILADPEYLSSVAIFLNHVDGVVPHELLKVIGVDKKKMPKLNEEWLEILLTGFLFNEPAFQPEHESMAKAIEGRLRRIGAIERRRAILRNTREIRRLLTWSLSKLSSIAEIVREETESLGKDLRMVILTDYIRASELPTGPEDLRRPSRIGVAPIFELIRRLDLPSAKLAAVSGSLVLIPRSCEARFQQIALEEALQGRISTSPLDHDGRYLRMSVQEDLLARLVAVMTRLFGEGEITVLVGTKSLLGEGWDAPPMNSLVLASFVGSYMLSNQMRGRAMRVQPGNPGKTANIWHLVCVEPNNESAGDDFATLSRRFKAFLGVSYHEPVIENGIGRLGIPRPPLHASTVKAKNEDTLRRARDRAGLREAWEAALALGAEGQLVGEIEAPTTSLPRGFVFSNTVMAVLWQGFLIASFVASRFLSAGGSFESIEQYLLYLTIVIVIGAVVMLPFTVKALWLFLKHGSIESSMKQIGEALLHTLIGLGLVKTDRSKLGVVAERTDQPGTVFCHLRGGTTYEKHLYLDALREILDPVENPRYLVERRSWFTMLAQRDYHAVPAIVGTRKAHARMFSDEWRSYVGPTKLIYTRTTKGRRVLLRARQHSLAAAFQKRSERRSAWK